MLKNLDEKDFDTAIKQSEKLVVLKLRADW
jgi:hypothetical protein